MLTPPVDRSNNTQNTKLIPGIGMLSTALPTNKKAVVASKMGFSAVVCVRIYRPPIDQLLISLYGLCLHPITIDKLKMKSMREPTNFIVVHLMLSETQQTEVFTTHVYTLTGNFEKQDA